MSIWQIWFGGVAPGRSRVVELDHEPTDAEMEAAAYDQFPFILHPERRRRDPRV
jgi:hypothetical protein